MPVIDLPVGIVSTPTNAKNSANWRDSHLVRWSGTVMLPVGGWQRFVYSGITTSVRAIHEWQDNTGKVWVAYLTEDDLLIDDNGTLTSVNPTPPITPYVGDLVDGGYGDNTYNYDDYGTSRPATTSRRLIGPAFTLDNWGQELRAMSSEDGRLLAWVPSSPPNPATVVENAPTGNRTFVITPERFIQVFGPGGGSLYKWCDQEDDTNWTEDDVASKAGEQPIEPAAPLVAAVYDGTESLFWTTKAAYKSVFQGLPYVFGTFQIGEGTVPISAQSVRKTAIGAVWPAESGFWYYNGSALTAIQCDVWPWVEETIDWGAARQLAAAVDMVSFAEYWFMFPSKGSDHNDCVAVFNYRDGWWAKHNIARSAGYSSSYSEFPILADRTSVYQHESGTVYGGADLPFAETFVINVNGGEAMGLVKQLMPDVRGDYSDLRFSLAYRFNRIAQSDKYSPKRRVQPNGLVDIDQAGRDLRLRVDQVAGNGDWTLGPVGIDIKQRGVMP